ncbi:hypothetical protein AAXE64_08210 [Priestia megaterium]
MSLPKQLLNLTNEVFEGKEVAIEDWDLDRIYVTYEGEEYTIRTWNITDSKVDWTLFKSVDNGDGTGHGVEQKEGVYKIKRN